MVLRMTVAAALLTVGAPGGAWAAEHIECVGEQITPAERSEITKAMSPEKELGEALTISLGTKAATCARRYGWSEPAIEAAVQVTVADAALPALRTDLAAQKVDLTAVDKVIADLPPEIKSAMFRESGLTEAQQLDVGMRVLQTGLGGDETLLTKVGFYMGAVLAREDALKRFRAAK